MVWGGGISQLGAEFVNLSQDCFLKSFQNKTIEPAIFLLSKSQTRPPIKILYLFCYYTFHHISLKTPIPCQSFFNPLLFIISINPIIPEKGTPAVATNLEKKRKKSNVSFINSLTYQVIRGGYKSGGCTSRRGQQHVYILLLHPRIDQFISLVVEGVCLDILDIFFQYGSSSYYLGVCLDILDIFFPYGSSSYYLKRNYKNYNVTTL